MSKIAVLLLSLFFFNVLSIPQSILLKYEETNNMVSFDLGMDKVKYSVTFDQPGTIIQFEGLYDVSNPGVYGIPSKSIIIALPSYSKITAQLIPTEKNKINGRPAVNPSAVVSEDGTITYFKEALSKEEPVKDLIEIEGYLWVRGYYCVSLRIHQYQYNNDIIEEITKAKVVLNIVNPSNSAKEMKTESDGMNEYLSAVILNYSNANPLNKGLYEPSPVDFSWIDFSRTYLKVGTANDGIYRIRKSDLQNYGINTSEITVSTLKLFIRGNEIPILVNDNGNNQLDDNEYIEFFGIRNMGDNYREISTSGQSYKEYLNRYSDTTIYWLTWGGSDGNRLDTIASFSGTPQDTILYYAELDHQEWDRYLDYSIETLARRQLPQWLENQTWVWGQQAVGTAHRSFTATDVYPNTNAKAFYKVQDYASDPPFNHKIGLSINQDPTVYDSVTFFKYQQRVIKAEFNSNLLTEGNNILKTISFPTPNPINTVAYDWYEVEYPRYLKLKDDSLKIVINDVQGKVLRYFKFTNVNGANPILYKYKGGFKKISNFTRNGSELIFADSVSSGDKYYIINEGKITAPVFYYKKSFQNLADASNSAEYILLTHPLLMSKAAEYSDFVTQSYNVTTKTINVFDIYDQFNYGFFAPEPIKDFLKAAYDNWQSPKPSYLFIAGDATYDYYNNKHKYFGVPETINLVPSFGEPVSDPWFTMWDTTSALTQQMFVGRVPAGNTAEFDHFLEKHRSYFNEPFDDWNKYYLLFSSGNFDKPEEMAQLKRINDSLITMTIVPPPIGGIARHLYKTVQPRTNFGPYTPEQINDYIGTGGVFICYVGHSGTQIWDNGISDVRQLNNTRGKHSLISDFGCSTGKFAEPDIKAFGELFVNGLNGDAIGYTGNSSLGFVSTSQAFPPFFYNKLMKENVIELGKAHALAKAQLISISPNTPEFIAFVYCNTLFSDPLLKLKIPQKPNLNIAAKNISLDKNFLDDSIDSVTVKGEYFNYGKVENLPQSIEVTHYINGIEKERKIFAKILPSYKDSVWFKLPVKGNVGNHRLTFKVDYLNEIDEIYETDNEVTYTFNVASNAVRILTTELTNNLTNGMVRFINPVTAAASDTIRIELSPSPDFNSPSIFYKPLDTVYTKFDFTGLTSGSRYWMRAKLNDPASEYSAIYTFIYHPDASVSFYMGDTVSYKTALYEDLLLTSTGFKLSLIEKDLKVISAGFNDGSFAIVEINGNNFLPEGHLEGLHAAVFSTENLSFNYTLRFDYWAAPDSFSARVTRFLDTLSETKLVCFALSGNMGLGIDSTLKSRMRSFGSVYFDSVKFQDSWAIITRKGAPQGTVPEKWTKKFEGNATVDSLFITEQDNGEIVTSEFGPVNKWNNLVVEYNTPSGSAITIQPVGIKSTGAIDTLSILNIAGGSADLSHLNIYEKIKLIIRLSRTNNSNPELNTLRINFQPLNEVGTNYQVIHIDEDTVLIGEKLYFNFDMVNAGFTPAENFKVRVEKIASDNTREPIIDEPVAILQPEESRRFFMEYSSSRGSGASVFSITLDPDNQLREFFKDNNIYNIPFYVKSDTTSPDVKVTFDGIEIMDGDFISANPLIKIELNDPSLLAVTDTTAIKIKLNEEEVYFLNNPDITYYFNNSNPKMIVEFRPHLMDGEYLLNVQGINASGNISDSAGIDKRFVVDNTAKLLNVFNYPNPFKNETWFTFKLTQLPDEIRIRIYTIAGRLVREIQRNGSQLNFDFNRIHWDGRDEDGDNLANGVYIYKMIMKSGDKTENITDKIAIVK